jgi:DNA polymerase/3'-5' exonuclease PolX
VKDNVKNAIDNLDIDQLWRLAQEHPRGVLNKISVRQLGKRRIEKLHTYLSALDAEKLKEAHAFELLLFICAENELKNCQEDKSGK